VKLEDIQHNSDKGYSKIHIVLMILIDKYKGFHYKKTFLSLRESCWIDHLNQNSNFSLLAINM